MRIDGNEEFYINQYKRGYVHGHYDGYNKAIDDFVNTAKGESDIQNWNKDYGISFSKLQEIAEKLKERES